MIIEEAYYSQSGNKKSVHYHDCHQIILICRGRVSVSVNNKSFEAGSRNLLVFSRYENHSIEPLSAEYERYVLRLAPEAGRLSDVLSNRPEGFPDAFDTGEDFETIRLIFQKIHKEFFSSLPFREEMLEHLSGLLLTTLNRMSPYVEHNELVSKVKHIFERDFAKTYTIESLSREFSVSPSKLSHEFKRVTGTPVMEYLACCRIANAKRLLCESSFGIADIVEACGFSDSSNFSRTFKAREGLSPTDFRLKYSKS